MNKTPRENTAAPTRSAGSERFSADEQALMRAAFARRFKEAFDGASNAEIARRLNTSDATVHNYVEENRLPVYEMLVEIARVTGCNAHWLITGNGPRRFAKDIPVFTDEEAEEIQALARAVGRSFDQQVGVLAAAALEFRAKVK